MFYKYVPTTKVVPVAETYEIPSEIKEVLQDAIDVTETKVIVSYEIDGTDLRYYEKVSEYVKGKPDPFDVYSAPVEGESGENKEGTNGSGGTGGYLLNETK